jgi:hypothetical protein
MRLVTEADECGGEHDAAGAFPDRFEIAHDVGGHSVRSFAIATM